LKKISKKIQNIIYWTLLLFVVLIAILPTISSLNIQLPFRAFAVETGSMEPTIKVGDLIFVKEEKGYAKGDIITFDFKNNKTPITHRIEEINVDGTYKTKGDANSASDVDNVSKEQVIGKYFLRIPLLGYPINFVRTPLGFLILIVIPAIVISYEEFNKIKNEIYLRKKEKTE